MDEDTSSPLAGMRFTELLAEVQERLAAVARTQTRVQDLFDAFLSVSTGLDLDSTLQRVVESATRLVDARYGALGVLGANGGLARFIHVGMDADLVSRIGHLPEGLGVLGQLVEHPQVLRIADLGEHPASVGLPAGHPPMRSFLGVPVSVRGEVYGNLYLTEKRTGAFTAEDEVVVEALAGAAGLAVENARLYAEVEQQQRWTLAVGDVRSALLRGTGADEALHVVAQRVAELTGADAAFVALGPDRAGAFEVHLQSAGAVPDLTGVRLEGDDPLLAALTSGGTAVLLDGAAHAGAAGATGSAAPAGSSASSGSSGRAGTLMPRGPAIAVPLHVSGLSRAALVAVRRPGGEPFAVALGPLVSAFADQSAIALDSAARQRASRRLAQSEDRDRIARDLHDHVIQRIFAAGLSLQASLASVPDGDAHERVERVVAALDETVSDIRTTVFELHTTGGSDGGLRRRVLDAASEAAGTALTLTTRLVGPVDTLVTGSLAADVVAVVREGTTNAARHSRGDHVRITVEATDRVSVVVTDDGAGIAPGAARSGLVNLERRAAARGGASSVEALPGGGTQLRWWAPLAPD